MNDKQEEILTYINNISNEIKVGSGDFIEGSISKFYNDSRPISDIKKDIDKYCNDFRGIITTSNGNVNRNKIISSFIKNNGFKIVRLPMGTCQAKILDKRFNK
ncbi:MAG: hypothetical protein PHQ64_04110 [Bacilli bacterium]|nr:hypothetical protein [Bacilli bacterium]